MMILNFGIENAAKYNRLLSPIFDKAKFLV